MEPTKTDTIQSLIEKDLSGAPSPWTNSTQFAQFIVALGLVEGDVRTAEVLVRRVVERLRPRRIVVASDFHVPFHNVRLVENWLAYLSHTHVDAVVLDGDIFDCEAISRFTSSPKGPTLQEELDAGNEILDAVEDIVGPSTIKAIGEGNHEERLRRMIGENPGLYGLRALTFPSLLSLEDRGWEWFEYGKAWQMGKLSVIHGHKVSKHSAYTAKAHLLDGDYDTVLHGHTHRLGSYYLTGVKGTRRGFEIGGLFDKKQATYVTGPKNWQNGFAVADVFPDGDVHVQLIEATDDGVFVADGKVFR